MTRLNGYPQEIYHHQDSFNPLYPQVTDHRNVPYGSYRVSPYSRAAAQGPMDLLAPNYEKIEPIEARWFDRISRLVQLYGHSGYSGNLSKTGYIPYEEPMPASTDCNTAFCNPEQWYDDNVSYSSGHSYQDRSQDTCSTRSSYYDGIMTCPTPKVKPRSSPLLSCALPFLGKHPQYTCPPSQGRMTSNPSWTSVEDKALGALVKLRGASAWRPVATELASRNFPRREPKQCRERWISYVDPDIKKGKWDREEDRILLLMHECFGNQWARISSTLKGRNHHFVKNRYIQLERQQAKNAIDFDVEKAKCVESGAAERILQSGGIPPDRYADFEKCIKRNQPSSWTRLN